jgi:ABC-type glycerol-3-phosphate transport system substrate-binding protein
MTKFQLIITGVFGLFIIFGVAVFSTYRGSTQNAVNVVVWGTIPQSVFENIVQKTSLYQSKEYKVTYVQKSEERFDRDFIEALASGVGPDLFMLRSDKILTHRNKVYPIPYNVFTQRQFRDSFIQGAEIYMSPEGVLGIPLYVDPLVMYWNRSIFNQSLETKPPQYWDEFYRLAPIISIKDGSLNILRSTVAFGEYANISNAKAVLLNLAMQAGTSVIDWAQFGPRVTFASSYSKPIIPSEAAVNFYTEFSNPSRTTYSWNRSLPNSTTYFLSGDLAMYFGFASEITNLQVRNPNLNFDVAPVPTSREGGESFVYSNFNSFAITNASRNKAASFAVASILTDRTNSLAFSKAIKLPPVRRDLLNQRQTDAYEIVFYNSAINARAWLDPNPIETNIVFRDMIESITSGRSRMVEAINRANSSLANLLKQ